MSWRYSEWIPPWTSLGSFIIVDDHLNFPQNLRRTWFLCPHSPRAQKSGLVSAIAISAIYTTVVTTIVQIHVPSTIWFPSSTKFYFLFFFRYSVSPTIVLIVYDTRWYSIVGPKKSVMARVSRSKYWLTERSGRWSTFDLKIKVYALLWTWSMALLTHTVSYSLYLFSGDCVSCIVWIWQGAHTRKVRPPPKNTPLCARLKW